eukprot:s143_g13.t1
MIRTCTIFALGRLLPFGPDEQSQEAGDVVGFVGVELRGRFPTHWLGLGWASLGLGVLLLRFFLDCGVFVWLAVFSAGFSGVGVLLFGVLVGSAGVASAAGFSGVLLFGVLVGSAGVAPAAGFSGVGVLLLRLFGVLLASAGAASAGFSGVRVLLFGVLLASAGGASAGFSGVRVLLFGVLLGSAGVASAGFSGVGFWLFGVLLGSAGVASAGFAGVGVLLFGVLLGSAGVASAAAGFSGVRVLLFGVLVPSAGAGVAVPSAGAAAACMLSSGVLPRTLRRLADRTLRLLPSLLWGLPGSWLRPRPSAVFEFGVASCPPATGQTPGFSFARAGVFSSCFTAGSTLSLFF